MKPCYPAETTRENNELKFFTLNNKESITGEKWEKRRSKNVHSD